MEEGMAEVVVTGTEEVLVKGVEETKEERVREKEVREKGKVACEEETLVLVKEEAKKV